MKTLSHILNKLNIKPVVIRKKYANDNLNESIQLLNRSEVMCLRINSLLTFKILRSETETETL
jgi:hypothetical protein